MPDGAAACIQRSDVQRRIRREARRRTAAGERGAELGETRQRVTTPTPETAPRAMRFASN